MGDKRLLEDVERHVPSLARPESPSPPDTIDQPSVDPRLVAAPVTRVLSVAILGSRGIPARYGGFETFAEELATRLVRQLFRATVFCERERGPRPASYEGVDLVHVRTYPVGPLRTILFDVECLIRSLRGYDVIYMLGYGAAWAFWLPRLFGVPIVVNMDGIEWKRSKWSPFARWYLRLMETVAVRLATHVVADADGIREHLEERHGPLSNCSIIPYGARLVESSPDEEVCERFGVRPGEYYLAVCRMEPENHVLEIVRAFGQATGPHPLLVVGPMEDTPFCRVLREAAGKRVTFVGAVYDREVLQALRFHARAYVHGHSVGGTNPSLLESLACGSEVFAHENRFNREVLGDDGVYFRDETDLEARIAANEDNGNGDRAREVFQNVVRSGYTWEHVVAEYEKLFDRLTR